MPWLSKLGLKVWHAARQEPGFLQLRCCRPRPGLLMVQTLHHWGLPASCLGWSWSCHMSCRLSSVQMVTLMPKGWGCAQMPVQVPNLWVSTWSQHRGLYVPRENHTVAGAWEHENGDLEQTLEMTESNSCLSCAPETESSTCMVCS